jgi:hypothetical protein
LLNKKSAEPHGSATRTLTSAVERDDERPAIFSIR